MSTAVEGTPEVPNDAEQSGAVKEKAAAQAEFNASTTVSTVGELQTKAPEFYKAMQEGIAFQIIREQREHNRRMKELNRKGRQNQ